jgi:hypothetical protein
MEKYILEEWMFVYDNYVKKKCYKLCKSCLSGVVVSVLASGPKGHRSKTS